MAGHEPVHLPALAPEDQQVFPAGLEVLDHFPVGGLGPCVTITTPFLAEYTIRVEAAQVEEWYVYANAERGPPQHRAA